VQWVVEYRRELATEDMPRKPVAGKARRRIGHWGVRYRTMMMSHLVTRRDSLDLAYGFKAGILMFIDVFVLRRLCGHPFAFDLTSYLHSF
jgi:hypothetical protein